MSAKIPVRRGGKTVAWALVDAQDLDLLNRWLWSLNGRGYAYGSPGFMHRVLLGLKKRDGREIDHINRNRLDNRRANLRLCDRSSNMLNTERGVEWLEKRERIRELRRAGYRRAEVAMLLRTTSGTVRKYDGGEPEPQLPRVEWTRERIAEAIRGFYERTGRVPRQADFASSAELPCFVTVYRRFSGFAEARECAGLGRLDLRRRAA